MVCWYDRTVRKADSRRRRRRHYRLHFEVRRLRGPGSKAGILLAVVLDEAFEIAAQVVDEGVEVRVLGQAGNVRHHAHQQRHVRVLNAQVLVALDLPVGNNNDDSKKVKSSKTSISDPDPDWVSIMNGSVIGIRIQVLFTKERKNIKWAKNYLLQSVSFMENVYLA